MNWARVFTGAFFRKLGYMVAAVFFTWLVAVLAQVYG